MRRWRRKFALALRGVAYGVRGQDSFYVHLPVAVGVLFLATLLGCMLWQWCVLLLCIAMVLSAELANSAIEHLAAGLCNEHNARVGHALDIAGGAVLIASIFSALIGAIIFIDRLRTITGW